MRLGLPLALYLPALLSKETAVVIPVLALVSLVSRHDARSALRKARGLLAGWCGLIAAYGALRLLAGDR